MHCNYCVSVCIAMQNLVLWYYRGIVMLSDGTLIDTSLHACGFKNSFQELEIIYLKKMKPLQFLHLH